MLIQGPDMSDKLIHMLWLWLKDWNILWNNRKYEEMLAKHDNNNNLYYEVTVDILVVISVVEFSGYRCNL